ncbi:MAG: MurR/RpiR family transcriptional regulator [Saccharofermentanales bacterium]
MPEILLDKRKSCLLKIRGTMDSLKSAERRIAQYICDNPAHVVKLTIQELSAECDSSYATVNRFCKKMGYSGFKELKAVLVNDIMNNKGMEEIKDIDITPDMTTSKICEKVYDVAFRILEDSFAIIDVDTVDKVVVSLLKARKIIFIGTGNSGLSAKYAYSKFFRIGLPCINEDDATLRKLLVSLAREGDIVFAISSSGRSEDIVDCARTARANGAEVISLSDFTISPLSKTSDLNLYTTPRSVSAFIGIDMPLTIGQLTIIDMLYICCCKALGDKATRTYQSTKSAADSGKV